jgi:CID domain
LLIGEELLRYEIRTPYSIFHLPVSFFFPSGIVTVSIMSHNWPGESELNAAMAAFVKKRPIAASNVKAATKIALKHAAEYKMVVYCIESFIKKASNMDKLCGIYVIDAICRQPKSYVLPFPQTIILIQIFPLIFTSVHVSLLTSGLYTGKYLFKGLRCDSMRR